MTGVKALLRAVALGALATSLWGCAVPATSQPAPPPVDGPRRPGSALDVLGALTVRGRGPMTGYSREAFGPAWLDANRNGCDERNDTLTRDLQDLTEKNCRVLTGTLLDPYTAQQIPYVYGDGTLVDVDHVVSLGNAWASGAASWPIRRRAALATDPMNLLAVDASANRQKGDGDAATWLPPNKAYRCAYVARQVAVKAKFDLSVTSAEKEAITRVLRGCPDQPLPADSGAALEVSNNITEPPETDPTPGAYADCDAARAAGAAPLRRGDPGYSASLDGDGDGSACE
ncbi:GmrSD restriction endonuclease domain-containing protein [Nocardioides rubriscoriae]|uniref:GmrSD restriction endonuclease domain-containing protein n=1 Tax=Nocardioides rubriscoriae TaxID=642762 RepID=UPI0011DF9A36|nr:DUF1524 domain-containing protein [Nocardioides rubriscoriae]